MFILQPLTLLKSQSGELCEQELYAGSDLLIDKELEPMKVFETQSGLARLLLFLYLEGPENMTLMIDTSNIYPNVGYAAARKATELGLITMDFDPIATYRTRKLQLTEKGRFIAKRLDEINNALSTPTNAVE